MYKISDETIIEFLVDKNMTDNQAAEELGINRMSVCRRRKKLGIRQKPKRPDGYYGITPDQNNKLIELYSQGLNDYEVAKIMKFGRNRLRDWRSKNGIVSKTNKKGLTHEDYKKALIMREEGKTYDEIAIKFGVNRTSISKLLKKHGYADKDPYRPIHPDWVDNYSLSDTQRSVIIGDLFGDGTLVPTSNSKAYYQTGHSNYQEFFIRWKYSVLLPAASNVDGRVDGSAFIMKTWTMESLGDLYKIFYPNGSKALEFDACSLLDDIALSVWYMGDGSLGRKVPYIHVGKQVDIQLLRDCVHQKLGLDCYFREYAKENHLVFNDPNFFKRINKYILPQFHHKTIDKACGSFWSAMKLSPYITSAQFKDLNPGGKEKVIDSLCEYYRKKGFPFHRCNKRELKKLSLSFKKGNKVAGYKICNHYMPHRLSAKRFDSDPMKHWDDDNLFRKFIENRLKYADGYVSDSVIRTGMQLKGIPANFSPFKAKLIYDKYLPEKGSTLDFSSGYGGRLLGFMASASGRDYTGVEPNSKSYAGLNSMKYECSDFFERVDKDNINLINAPFEDVSSNFDSCSFDLVFSSPPYFGLEIYSNEETQSIVRYPDYKDWLDKFWFCVLAESLRVLRPGGHLIYTIGNYKDFDLAGDSLRHVNRLGFTRCDFDQIYYKNVYANSNKKEIVFIFKK